MHLKHNMYVIQQGFICRPSDSTISEAAKIEPRTVATLALTTRLDLIHSKTNKEVPYEGMSRLQSYGMMQVPYSCCMIGGLLSSP